MPRAKKEEKVEETPAETKTAKKGFVVLDSNGKAFRTVEKEEQAKELAKILGGRIA